jgi:hypothetical protein
VILQTLKQIDVDLFLGDTAVSAEQSANHGESAPQAGISAGEDIDIARGSSPVVLAADDEDINASRTVVLASGEDTDGGDSVPQLFEESSEVSQDSRCAGKRTYCCALYSHARSSLSLPDSLLSECHRVSGTYCPAGARNGFPW